MHADAISNFFNNPVTEESVRALDSYIQDRTLCSKTIQSALELLLKPIPLNQVVTTLESWTGRIINSNPKPARDTCELMYRALDALRLDKSIKFANEQALQARLDAQSALKSNARTQLVLMGTLPAIGGAVAGPVVAGSFTFAAVVQGAACGLGVGGTWIFGETVYNSARGNNCLIKEALKK